MIKNKIAREAFRDALKEGTIERRLKLSDVPEKDLKEFEEIWRLYPNKKGKQNAKRGFKVLLKKGYTTEQIKTAILRYANLIKTMDKQYIQHGNTFLNHGIYDYFDDNYKLIVQDEKEQAKLTKNKLSDTKIKIKLDTPDDYEKLIQYFKSMPYEEYLLTEHWRHFRNEALKWADHKCQLCNEEDTTLIVHHKTYENRGRETFNDVIVLCEDCHRLVHEKVVRNI